MPMNPRLLVPRQTFSPKSLTGLQVWIDFSDTASVTLDGSSKISAVTDKSGNGYNGAQTTSGNRLGIGTLNGRQCADGGTSAHSLAVLYTHGGNTLNLQEGYFAGVWDAGGSTFPSFNGILTAPSITGTASGAYVIGNSGTANLFGTSSFHRSTDGGSVSRFNNTSVADGNTLAAFPAITSTFVYRGYSKNSVGVNGWMIGNDRAVAGRGWLGRIGEVIFYNRILSDAEALKIRRYLATKWGAPAQT